MTPRERALLRIEWHREGHPDLREPRWAGLFRGAEAEDDGLEAPPFQPSPEVLVLSGCGLRTVPPEAFDVKGVTMLMLGNQPLAELPDSIGRMNELEQLELTFTRLETIPDAVFRLPCLTDLYLQGSPIRQLPASLAGSPLKMITLDESRLQALPDFGGAGSALTSLSLARCGLSAVPPEVATAPHLTDLCLDHNPLVDLSALAGLRHLARLQLNDCGLTSLPRLLADLPFAAAFAELRARGKAAALARGMRPEEVERMLALPLRPGMGLTVGRNPFKDKALKAAAKLADAEARTFALQDWCRQKGG
jgi:Leucine-rich repeat (LRR) protein